MNQSALLIRLMQLALCLFLLETKASHHAQTLKKKIKITVNQTITSHSLVLSEHELREIFACTDHLIALYQKKNKLSPEKRKIIISQAKQYLIFYHDYQHMQPTREYNAQLATRIALFTCLLYHQRIYPEKSFSYEHIKAYKKIIKKLLYRFGFMKRADQQCITDQKLRLLIRTILYKARTHQSDLIPSKYVRYDPRTKAHR